MCRFITRRLILLIPVLLGVSFIVFSILSLTPGDPVQIRLGENYTPESYASMKHEMGLDQPYILRYLSYIGSVIRGDFGKSYTTNNPVVSEIMARFPNTLLLSFCAMLFAIVIGVSLGVISATRQYSFLDSTSMVAALIGVSMPNFWLGLMIILVFAARLGWFPSAGFKTFRSLVLPALTLSANSLAIITRMTRSSMLETIRMDYIRTARAKGVNESTVILKHALRNALMPVVTTIGLQFGFSIGGAVLVETVYSWPGLGRLLVEAIKYKDMPLVTAIVIILATMFTVINLFVDVLYAALDPRIRAQYNGKG